MIHKKLKPSDVKVPEVRVTATYDEELTALLKDSLAVMGQQQPIVVVETNGIPYLVDGLHRLQEALNRGDEEIDAVVTEGEEKDVLLKNLVLNRLRGKTKASEMVTVIGSLYHDHGLDSDGIRDATGLPRDYIERIMRISEASPSVQEALDQELIGVGHAFEISRIPAWIAQDEIIAKYQVWRWTVKELRAQVDLVLAEIDKAGGESPPARAPGVPLKYCCEGCQSEADLRYLRPTLLCPNCFGVVWRVRKADQEAAAAAAAAATAQGAVEHEPPADEKGEGGA